jgi:penicillin amidase
MRVLRRLTIAVAAILLALVAILGGALWYSLPPSEQEVRIAGLSAPVAISIDVDGVPRIRAATEADAAAALGFLHGRDRMFQLELMRRGASGRLSEWAGTRTVAIDRAARVLGFRALAEAEAERLPAGDRALLDAYARGVNAWIAARGRFSAPELIPFGTPEPWTPVDTLLWAKMIGLWLSGNWQQELARLALAETLPPERIAELWPSPVPGAPRLVATAAVVKAARDVLEAVPYTGTGHSNAWAVAGVHSRSGAPLLAGDPHLLYTLPGNWYLVRIERPDGVWAGASAPGVPGIVLGRNSHIAWSFTTTGADTQDVFIETPVGESQYVTPEGPRDFGIRTERIGVLGAPDEVLTVRTTRHGPVISDIRPAPGGALLAVAMMNLATDDTAATGFLALNRARSVAEAGAAAAVITSPVQNMVVADRERIALFTTGRVPVRRAGDGRMPVPGADDAHDWIGLAAGERLPVVIDPPNGRIANTNEPVAPPDFPVFIGADVQGDWRTTRLLRLMDAPAPPGVEDMARMQADIGSDYARLLLPRLLAVPLPPGAARQAQEALRGWDGAMTMASPAPLIFSAWLDQFRDELLRQAGVAVNSAAIGRLGFVAWLLGPGPEEEARGFWCGGSCDARLAAALEAAVARLAARLGPDPAAWRWDAVHAAVFAHPVLRFVPWVGRWVEGRTPTGGHTTTLNRQEALFGGFESVHGGALRAVYDMSDLERSRYIVVPGQSGHPLAPTARGFVERWAAGELIELGPESAGPVSARVRLLP